MKKGETMKRSLEQRFTRFLTLKLSHNASALNAYANKQKTAILKLANMLQDFESDDCRNFYCLHDLARIEVKLYCALSAIDDLKKN